MTNSFERSRLSIISQVSALHPCQIYASCAAKNGKWVFTAGEDGFIRKYNLQASMKGELLLTNNQRSIQLDLVSKGGVMIGAWDNTQDQPNQSTIPETTVALDGQSDASLIVPEVKHTPVYAMDVHSECVWMLTGCECLHVFKNHTTAVSAIKIRKDEKSFMSGSWDKTLNHWDLNNGSLVNVFKGPTSHITSIEWNPVDLNMCLATSYDGTLWIYDLRTSENEVKKITTVESCAPWCLSACWSKDGQTIFAGRRNATVDEIDVSSGEVKNVLKLPKNSGVVSSLLLLNDNRHLITGSNDNLRLWDLSHDTQITLKKSHDLNDDILNQYSIIPGHHSGIISSLIVDSENKYLISTSGARGYEGNSSNNCIFYDIQIK